MAWIRGRDLVACPDSEQRHSNSAGYTHVQRVSTIVVSGSRPNSSFGAEQSDFLLGPITEAERTHLVRGRCSLEVGHAVRGT